MVTLLWQVQQLGHGGCCALRQCSAGGGLLPSSYSPSEGLIIFSLHWDAPGLNNEEGRCLLQVILWLVTQWQVPSELCQQCRCVKAWCV